MATTSPDNLRTFDSGDPYALVQDMGILADTIQNALIKRANAYVGTVSHRTAFTTEAPLGTIWSDTDADRLVWKKGATDWESVSPYSDSGNISVSFSSGYSAHSSGFDARKFGPIVFLEGGVSKSSGNFTDSLGATVATLPSNARPKRTVRVPLVTYNSTAAAVLYAEISSGGAISIGRMGSFSGGSDVYFGGVSFLASDS